MTSHDEILERMSGANPLPDVEMITDGQLAEMTLQVEQSRRADQPDLQPIELEPLKSRLRWRRPAIAFAAAMLAAGAVVGIVSLTTGDESAVADPTSPTTPPPDVTPEDWNTVLTTIAAGPAPEAAVCPPGSDPSQPGPESQERPEAAGVGSLSAAFDHRTGQVIYVDSSAQTWGFDVCTNTWTNLRPSGTPGGYFIGGLVYDIDSDLTVAIESDVVFIYNAAANTWEQRTNTSGAGGIGAAYDSVSGLIITSSPVRPTPGGVDPDAWTIQAYDVDTNTWYDLGVVPLPRVTPCCTGIDLLGYSAELDRLVLTTYVDEGEATLLLDIRNGEMSIHVIPTPVVNLAWPGSSYGPADTVFVKRGGDDFLCGFNAATIAWDRCHTAPAAFPALKHQFLDAIVGDPINNRLLLIGGTYGGFGEPQRGIDDVWAIDLGTSEWAEILAPTGFVDYPETDRWNGLLAATRANAAPEPATCPGSSDPDTPGRADQARPRRGTQDDHDAAFDRRTGRIMHVDSAGGTWAFDVCTNTWLRLNPVGDPIDQSLVYDVDSDVTIALGPGDFSVYDAKTNTWSRPAIEVVGGRAPKSFAGVAYDPVSGLVITTGGNSIWAYDVDSNRLTPIGAVPEFGIYLAGYLPDVDMLVIGVAWSDSVLVDPRTGEQSPAPDELPFLTRYHYHDGKGAAAVDTINNRLVVIGSYSTDDVVGIDMGTSELIQLLAPST